MKAKRLILALAATTVLASCGKGKEISQEEAQDVAKNISKKVEAADFKNPEKIQLFLSVEGYDDDDKLQKMSVEINYSKPDYFYSVIVKSNNRNLAAYNYWEKNANLLYTVLDSTSDGKRSFAYSTLSVDASKIEETFASYTEYSDSVEETGYSMDFSNIGKLAGTVAIAATASSNLSFDFGDIVGGSVETHYYSSGEGNLVVEMSASGKAGTKTITETGSFYLENYLVTKITANDSEGSKVNLEFRYGRANTAKPDLNDASKVEQ